MVGAGWVTDSCEVTSMGESERPEGQRSGVDAKQAARALWRQSPGFWPVNGVNLGDNIAYFLILPFLVTFLGEQGLSDEHAGFAVSFYTGAVTLAMLWGGQVSDRLRVRRAITLSLVLSLLGRGLLAACPWLGLWSALLGLLLAALGAGVGQPALYAGVKATCHPLATPLGYSVLYSTLSLGIGVGSFFSPYLRTAGDFGLGIQGLGWGVRGVMVSAAVVTALTLVFHLLAFRPSMDGAAETDDERPKSIPLDPRFLYFICVLIPVRTLFAHQFLTVPSYVLRTFPLTVSNHLEWLLGLNPPIVLILVPLFTLTTRKVSIVDVMIVGTAVTSLSTFLLAGPPRLDYLMTYIVLFSVGEAMWGSRFLEHVAEMAPPGKLGIYMAFANMPWFFAKFSTGLYSGWMLDRFVPAHGAGDPARLWLIYGCVAVLSPLGLLLGRRWLLSKSS